MPRLTSLSIFFPCYNDAGTIGSMVSAADAMGRELSDDYEVIVVNDCSIDHSAEVLEALQRAFPALKVITHQRNRGYGGALRSGFANATKEFVFYTDGDAQYDVFELRELARIMSDDIDVVNGYKIYRNDPAHRRIIGWLYLKLMRLLFNFHVRDVDCDFRLIRRRALEGITLTHSSGVICLELVKKLELNGALFVDYPVHHYFRTHGKSQFFNFSRLFRTGIAIFRLWLGFRLKPKKHLPPGLVKRSASEVNPTLKQDHESG